MQKINFSVDINAPVEKVWNTMLGEDTYKEWTYIFNPGSDFKGTWEKGSKMLFIGPDPETGAEMGMVSRIAENKPFEFISIEHLGIYKNGVEDLTSVEARKWSPAFENYSFKHNGDVTTVSVDQDIEDEYHEMFAKLWVDALQKLKELCEK
jgi:hypothetical protein